MLPSLVVAGIGVVLLVALLIIVGVSVARFTRARAALQEQVAQRTAVLHALRRARRSGSS